MMLHRLRSRQFGNMKRCRFIAFLALHRGNIIHCSNHDGKIGQAIKVISNFWARSNFVGSFCRQ
jgi:hypothetical protein